MSDALHKTTGDPATPGYRPLPGSGPTRGAELRTTVYAGLGIALGIFAGTFVADGTVERMLAGPQHQVAEVRPQAAAVAPSSSMAAVSTPQTIAAATTSAIVPAVEPARNEAPVAAADARPHEAQPAPPRRSQEGSARPRRSLQASRRRRLPIGHSPHWHPRRWPRPFHPLRTRWPSLTTAMRGAERARG